MSRRLNVLLLEGKSAADATGIGLINEADIANVTELGFHIEFDHTSAAGTVLIETASNSAYAGTWAVLATVTWAAIDKSHYVGVTDALACVRARISSAVTSGTVSVRAVGNMT